jgi:hypothetical protein
MVAVHSNPVFAVSKASVTQQQHEKNIKELETMASKPPNDRCADCNDKGDKRERWRERRHMHNIEEAKHTNTQTANTAKTNHISQTEKQEN